MAITPEEKLLRRREIDRRSYWKNRERYLAEYREQHPKKPPATPEEKRLRNREKTLRYNATHKDKVREIARRSYSKNKDARNARRRANHTPQKVVHDAKWKRQREAQKRSYQKHRDKYLTKQRAAYRANKHWLYVRNYRLARQQAEALRPKPERCDVCGDDQSRIEYDHCHQRGVFRGWLCSHCNVILGHAKDDPNRLRKLIVYLERTKDLVPSQLTLPV